MKYFYRALQNSPEEEPKKPYNDDMILVVFHIGEDPRSADTGTEAGRPVHGTARCRCKTFFVSHPGFSSIPRNCKVDE